jgi:hypothetical protein
MIEDIQAGWINTLCSCHANADVLSISELTL